MGEKQPLVGGTNKLPQDFQKPAQFLDDEQMLAARLDTLKPTAKRGVPLWDRPDIAQAIASITPECAAKYTLTREELVAATRHREEAYMTALGSKREAKKNVHLTKRVEEGETNLGMSTRR